MQTVVPQRKADEFCCLVHLKINTELTSAASKDSSAAAALLSTDDRSEAVVRSMSEGGCLGFWVVAWEATSPGQAPVSLTLQDCAGKYLAQVRSSAKYLSTAPVARLGRRRNVEKGGLGCKAHGRGKSYLPLPPCANSQASAGIDRRVCSNPRPVAAAAAAFGASKGKGGVHAGARRKESGGDDDGDDGYFAAAVADALAAASGPDGDALGTALWSLPVIPVPTSREEWGLKSGQGRGCAHVGMCCVFMLII